ncbi:glycoside hydrolase family 97 protein [Pelagicoccus enzymogenes]|nr:glycoside hydrolase family 97 protein [Pelagicoccus enzymogenes]
MTLGLCAKALAAVEVNSPNGHLSVRIDQTEEGLSYSVRSGDVSVLEQSRLGLETSIGNFGAGLEFVSSEESAVSESYRLPNGKTSFVDYEANELVATYANDRGDQLSVVFRVSDSDVAYRYRVNSEERHRVVVESEQSSFNLPDESTAFVTWQVPWGGGYAATKPSYEEGYLVDVPVDTKSHTGLGFTFPALFKLDSEGWLLISETGTTSQYVGTRLSDPNEEGEYRIAFPEAAENAGVGESTVSVSLPMQTPWRTITFGKTLAPIVESTVATDLVKPLYEPSKYYRPGRAAWSWLVWQDGSMNREDQVAFIDMAAALDFEYILIDAWWDERIGREGMKDLVEYARSKDVGVLLWYNSNGSWNDAPQTPRNRMASAPIRQEEMEWLQSIGVEGLKVDFFGGDKQVTMKFYEDLMTDANRYGLSLNFHGATLPRGWERMYPNHMTSEAVTASENLIFSQGFSDKEAFNSTLFPFVRNPVGAMDYGPVVLNERFSKSPERGNFRRTTDAFQLATSVLYFSPIQHYGLTPNNLDEQPAHVLDFFRVVPAAWDETRFVDGYPGEKVVLARRSGEDWYVAATHSSEESKAYELSLPWLAGKTLRMLHDLPDGTVGLKEAVVGDDGSLVVELEARGGVVLY